jgi:hypothetical protein
MTEIAGAWTQAFPPPALAAAVPHLPWVNVAFSVQSPILPGQPISASWEIWTFNTGLDITTVSASIYLLEGPQKLKLIDDDSAPFVVDGSHHSGSSGPQTAIINSADPLLAANKDLLNKVYKIGSKTLLLEIVTNGHDKALYTAPDDLVVVPESVDQSWWEWTSPETGGTFNTGWKKPYSVAGRFTNRSAFAGMQGSALLWELDAIENTQHSVGNAQPIVAGQGLVPPNGPLPIGFSEITQQWKWLIPAVWAEANPIFRDFNLFDDIKGTIKGFYYTARFSLVDEFENHYSEVSSGIMAVIVEVSQAKRVLAAAAIGNVALGLAFIYIWPFASGAFSAATAFGAGALDPPEPNYRYREIVNVSPASVQDLGEESLVAATFREFLALQSEMVALHDALTETQSRLLGAQNVHDAQGITRQRRVYKELVACIGSAARRAPVLAIKFLAAVEEDKRVEIKLQDVSPLTLSRAVSERARLLGASGGATNTQELMTHESRSVTDAARGIAWNVSIVISAIRRYATLVGEDLMSVTEWREKLNGTRSVDAGTDRSNLGRLLSQRLNRAGHQSLNPVA